MATVLASDAEAFRAEVRAWLDENLVGEYRALCGRNDLGDADEMAVRQAWEQQLAKGGWVGLSWPVEHGGRAATLTEELIFNEEYARADGPQRCGFFGEQLLGPTLMAFGTMAQQERFLGPILRAEEFWCQGFSEPDAGSDLANIKTTAVLDGDRWRINGQKVWTSLGHIADWIFVICRTEKTDGAKHRGLTFLLCPMDQAGVELRPIRQMTGSAEFNEVFFDDATTGADMVVGEIGSGWKTVMGTLGFERGTAFLAQQLRFAAEHAALVRTAQSSQRHRDPVLRQRLARSYVGLEIMRWTGMRTIDQLLRGKPLGPEASIGKLQWSRWHQDLTDLAMDVHGAAATVMADGELGKTQYGFQFSRAHTIYAGSSEIQRNIIAERVLGLPKEPV